MWMLFLYARLKNRTYYVMPLGFRPPSVNFLFPANSYYNLHPIKLKLDIYLDHDVK